MAVSMLSCALAPETEEAWRDEQLIMVLFLMVCHWASPVGHWASLVSLVLPAAVVLLAAAVLALLAAAVSTLPVSHRA